MILVSASKAMTTFPASSTRDHSGSTAIWRPIGDPGPRAPRRYRKISGVIIDRKAFPNMYVEPGTKLYAVADLSTVWVYAEVFQNDIGRVKVGDPASITVDAYPGDTFPARVSFIWPEVDRTTRRARVRLEIPNPQLKLLLGMYVDVRIGVPLGDQLAIPAAGVFQSGTRQIAFIDHGGGYFEPRDIELGTRAGDDFVVLKGLEAGERIATSANFLIDSESQLAAAPSGRGSGVSHECAARGNTRILLKPVASAQGKQHFPRQAHRRRRGGNHGRSGHRNVLHGGHARDGHGRHA